MAFPFPFPFFLFREEYVIVHPEEEDTMTPGRAQYLRIKRQYPDTILFYHVGDFYQLYDESALAGWEKPAGGLCEV